MHIHMFTYAYTHTQQNQNHTLDHWDSWWFEVPLSLLSALWMALKKSLILSRSKSEEKVERGRERELYFT